jgi:hypothetical protein
MYSAAPGGRGVAAKVSAEIGVPVTTESIMNFVIAAGVAWWNWPES